MDAEGSSPQGSPPTAPAPKGAGRRGPFRFAAMVVSVATAAGLVALLAYGLIARSPNTNIDDHLARNEAAPAPGFELALLRRGSLGPRLEPRLAPAIADGRVSSRELRGMPVVLNIWASWCDPCREEAPRLEQGWRAARPQGVLFVGLDMQDVTEDARRFMDHFGIDYLNIRDPGNDVARRYGATGIPETYFLSARGDVVDHVIGVVDTAQLRNGIAAAVAGRPQAASQGGARRSTR